jgi:hypothetical protein
LNSRVRRARVLVFLALVSSIHMNAGAASKGADAPHWPEDRSLSGVSSVAYEDPTNVSASGEDSRYPALAVSDAAVHVVWEESERVYHAYGSGDTWSSSRSVAVGEQPVIAADASGAAHAVFVNLFGGNYEVYYCRWNGSSWSLPRNVSSTSGVSSAPSLALAPDGTLHVVWADNTPGYNVIYHAYWDGRYWLNEPIPHAMGGAPAVAVGSDGVVHVVWHDREWPDAPYEVYYSRLVGREWSLPENLSDSQAQPSIIANLAVDQDGQAHVAWQEKAGGRYTIYYTWGREGYWSIPERLSHGEAEAYVPTLAVSQGSSVFVGWDESTLAMYRQKPLVDSGWSQAIQVIQDPLGIADLRLAVDTRGQLHAVWGKRNASGKWDVFYRKLVRKIALPIICRAHRH